jgi:hypothetical protein
LVGIPPAHHGRVDMEKSNGNGPRRAQEQIG